MNEPYETVPEEPCRLVSDVLSSPVTTSIIFGLLTKGEVTYKIIFENGELVRIERILETLEEA